MSFRILKRCRIVFGLVSLLTLILFPSCQIGLGETVDTLPAEISFSEAESAPVSNAVIRGVFALGGNWSDDGKISEVKINISSNSTSSTASVSGTVIEGDTKGSGTWEAIIDPFKKTDSNPDGLGLLDGTYDFHVVIKDAAGHSTEISRSYVIDNTAPVLILSRPSSTELTDDNKIESYGQFLTIEGQAADDNDVNSLEINFYAKEAPETLLYTKVLTNIPPTISLDVATFLDEAAYTAIYGNEKNGEKSYYCTINAYDSAKRYPVAGEEAADDSKGNCESSYILWTDWEKALSDAGLSLKVPDLYHIKSGVYYTSSTDRSVDSDKVSNMWSTLMDKKISLSSFKLNPENSPTYSVSGLNLGIITNVENDSSLTVQLAKGLDGISLNTDSMKVYLQACDEAGNALQGSEKLYPTDSTYYQKGDGQFLTKIIKNKCLNASGQSVNLVYGNLYIIGVEGNDVSGNTIRPSFTGQNFLIRFKAKNIAPEVNIESPSETISYLKKGTSLRIKGTSAVPDGYPSITIKCKKGAADSEVIYSKTFTDADKVSATEYLITYAFDFTVAADSSGSYSFDQDESNQYVFDIISSLDEMTTAYTKTVLYDIDAPGIEIESMLPIASKYSDDEEEEIALGSYLNGDVTMKVSIIDDYDTVNTAKTYWSIISSKSPEATAEKHYFTTPAKENFVIKTAEVAGTEEMTVRIYAEDRAGNSRVYEKRYNVDQSTDYPLIRPYTPRSVTLKYDSYQDITDALAEGITKSVMIAGSPLQIKIMDDDGIKEALFLISERDSGENLHEPAGFNQTITGDPVEYIFSYSLPTITGRYKCSLEVKDINNKTSSKEFWIAVTSPAPVVTLESTSPQNKIITTASSNTINPVRSITNILHIDSGYDSFNVSKLESGCAPVTLTTREDNSHVFQDILTPSASRNANKVTYTVTDENLHSGERVFEYYVDSTPPSIDAASIVVPTNTQTHSTSFRFGAEAKDELTDANIAAGDTAASGVAKLQYYFAGYNNSGEEFGGSVITVSNVSSISESVIFAEYPALNESTPKVFATEGKKKFYVRAIDAVGNVCDWVSKEFMYDKAEPSVQISSYKRGSETAISFSENSASKSFETGYTFELSGTASDGNGIESFEIWQKMEGHTYSNVDGIKLTDISVSSLVWNENEKTYEWTVTGLPRNEASITESNLASGTYIYTVRATDKSAFGSQSAKISSQSVTVKIDKTKPTVTINLAENNSSDSSAYGENSIKGNAYTFRGTALDEPENSGDFSSGFNTLYYAFTTTESEPAHPFQGSVNPSTESWSFTMNLGTGSGTDSNDTLYEGKKYLWVYGIDKAGNISDTKHVAFMVDQAAPLISSLGVYKNEDTATTLTPDNGIVYITDSDASSYTLRGQASDANGISKVTVDGTEVAVSDDGSWSKNFTAQGSFIHKVIVYDGSGKTGVNGKSSEKNLSVIYDKVAPTSTIADLDSDSSSMNTWISGDYGSDYYINGSASDTGSGLKEILIKVDSAEYVNLPLSSNWSYKYQIPENFEENNITADSYHTVSVKVIDNANNESVTSAYFRYDKNRPEANLALNKDGLYVNEASFTEGITLSGYAHDGRGESSGRQIKSAKILVSKDGAEQSSMTMDIKTDSSYVTSVGNTYGNFSKTLSAADFTDGRYAFTLQVKDLAENSPDATSALTASFIVDKTAPANLSAKFLVTEDGNTSEVTSLRSNKSKARISVSFTEANPDAVYYYVNDGSNADITQENAPADDWVSMNISGSGSSWTAAKDCSFNDGCGQVYIKVVDKAGNIAYATALPYEVDTKKPDVCTLSTVDSAVLVGSKLINGSNDVVFKVNASDYNDNPGVANRNDVTKIASVNLYQIGSGSASIITASGSEIGSPTMSGSGDSAVKTGEWTITIPKSRFSGFTTGSYPVTVIVKDTFDHTKTFQLFTLDVDTGKPEIKSYSLENSYDAGLVGESGAQVRTFYMNNQKNTFELSGIAKDDREIDKVTLTLTGTVNGEAKTKTLESSESAWTFEIGNLLAEGDTDTSNAWKNWSGSVTASISVIDKAKNVVENPISFTIIFDNTPPAAKHLFDSNGKDLYFRLGDQDNDTVNDNLDKAVGQMYSSGAYGNKDTIKIRGNFDEGTNGSGLKMIYYMLTTSLDQASALKTSFDSNPSAALTSTSGYFVPKSENKRVYYTDSTYSGSLQSLASYTSVDAAANSYSTVITSDFSESITGFSEGKNYLVLLAEDNVGNLSIDTFTLPSADSAQSYYQINLDTLPPEITALTSEVYTNASEALTLSFTVVDKINLNDDSCQAAGIKSVTVNMGGVSEEKEASLGEDGKWSVTIPSNKLPNTSGSCSLSVTALDKAGSGNSVTQSVGSVIVDRDPPELGINDITDADTSLDNVQVNGTISISGTANDSYGLKQILGLCYKIADSATKPASQTSIPESGWAAPDGWTKISATLAQSDILTAWTYTGIDTSKLDGINAISNGSTVWISAAVEDKAGNVSYADPKKVIVDQNSDRPILKFSNLPWDSARSGGAGVKEYNKNLQTLMGNISDDDGISEFKVKISSSEITTRPADMAAVTVSSGSFAISLGDDGQKYIWIYIKDSKGAVFETKASSSLNQPYLIFDNHKDASGKDIRSDSEAVLNFAINSTAPEITGFNYKTGSDSTALGSETAVSLGTTNYVGGSEKKYVSFSLNVSSAVPVTSVKAIASGVTGQYTFSQDESNTNIWNSPSIDIMADTWAEGAHTITFTVEDASGLTNVGTKQITVDKTGPEVSLTSPGADDVSGLITLKGTASDPNNYSSVSAVGFAIVDNRYYSALGTLKDDAEENIKAAAKASVSNLVPVSSVNTWSYLLDGVERTVSGNTYTNPALPTSESAVENTSTGINRCPLAHENNEDVRSVTIVFYAKDSLGNESYTPITSADGQTPISINFNPYGDRPSSTITYPSGIYR
nr:hypothetical protein [Treponema sp.]